MDFASSYNEKKEEIICKLKTIIPQRHEGHKGRLARKGTKAAEK